MGFNSNQSMSVLSPMKIKEFLDDLRNSIDSFPELYAHSKIDIIVIKKGDNWFLANGFVRLGMSDLLSFPQPLPTPDEITHISKILPTTEFLEILSKTTESNPVLSLDNLEIFIPCENDSLSPYVFPLFDRSSLWTEMGGFGTLYRLSGVSLHSLISGHDSYYRRILSEHYRSQATDLYQLIERATGVSKISTNSVTIDIWLPTYSKIEKVWSENDSLFIDYECPTIFQETPRSTELEVSHMKPNGSMRVIRPKSGMMFETGGTSAKVIDGIWYLSGTTRYRIPKKLEWPEGGIPQDGTLRVNLFHRQKEKLLCYYEMELGPPEIDDALSSLFSTIQTRVDDVLSKLDKELEIGLRQLLLETESGITKLDVRNIGGKCRSIIQEILLKIQEDAEYQNIEIGKTIVRVRLIVGRLKKSNPQMSDSLSKHLIAFSEYFENLNILVQRGHHNQKENLIDEDAKSLVAHLYLWLNDLFRLLGSAGWTPIKREFPK